MSAAYLRRGEAQGEEGLSRAAQAAMTSHRPVPDSKHSDSKYLDLNVWKDQNQNINSDCLRRGVEFGVESSGKELSDVLI